MAEKQSPEQLKEKLLRAMQAKAVLAEKSRLLQQQIDDARRREDNTDHVVRELLDRQRESNFMLHRANSVLHRLQETNLALSSEFTELVKELPAPNSPDWDQRVAKINDLFRRTGELADEVQDEIFRHAVPEEPKRSPERPQPPPETGSEPLLKAEPASVPEPVLVPEPEKAKEPALSPEPVFEAAPVEVRPEPRISHRAPVDAEFIKIRREDETDQTYSTRVDRLFGKLTDAPPPSNLPDSMLGTEETPESQGPNLFSRLRTKLSRRSREEGAAEEDGGTIDKAS